MPDPITEEDVRRAYYATAGPPQSWWITELQMDPPALIVADEVSGKIYRVPYEIQGAAVSFGSAAQVVSYSEVAAARATGDVVVYASAVESRDVEAGWPGESPAGDDPDDGLYAQFYPTAGQAGCRTPTRG